MLKWPNASLSISENFLQQVEKNVQGVCLMGNKVAMTVAIFNDKY